mmetsp:Transcript_110729/g.191950  ORF Transcript_110729/g.191950 Transcript_110729/m.191950 type:complete len:403 (-) Transcript_110729:97-1305(-)
MVLDKASEGVLHTASLLPPLGHTHTADGESQLETVAKMHETPAMQRVLVALERKLEAAERNLKISQDAQSRMAEQMGEARKATKKAEEGQGVERLRVHELTQRLQESRKDNERLRKKVEQLEIELMEMAEKVETGGASMQSRIVELEQFLHSAQDELSSVSQELVEQTNHRLAAEKEKNTIEMQWQQDQQDHQLALVTLQANHDADREELNQWRFIVEDKRRKADAMISHANIETRNLARQQAEVMQQMEVFTKLKADTDRHLEQLKRERKEDMELSEARARWDVERVKLEQQKLELKLEVEKLSRELERRDVAEQMVDNKKLAETLEQVVATVWEKENNAHDEERNRQMEERMAAAMAKEEQRKREKMIADGLDPDAPLVPQPPSKKGGKRPQPKKGGKKK